MTSPNKAAWLFFLPILGILLSACVTMRDPEASQDYRADVVATVDAGHSLAQTFISRRARLNGIQLWPTLGDRADLDAGQLVVEVRRGGPDGALLITYPVPYSTISDNSSIQIPIPTDGNPAGGEFTLIMRSLDGAVKLLGRAEDAYPNGQLWVNDALQNADLSFLTSYDYDPAAMLDDLRAIFASAWLLLPLAATLWLPGRLLLTLITHKDQMNPFDWGERAALSVGLSLTSLSVALLWSSQMNFTWTRARLWAALAGLAVAYLWLKREPLIDFWEQRKPHWSAPRITTLALAAIFIFSLFVRFAMVRDLAAPAWVDSVHHAAITRLILDNGQLPDSYSRFFESRHANYHSGFHSALAAFLWASGMQIHSGMLVYGQVLNALVVFAVYLFTKTILTDRRAAIAAAAICGLFTPMPAYYASWGRYTQLTALLILPTALALIVHASRRRPKAGASLLYLPGRTSLLLGAVLACAGLFLTHYQVTLFFGLYLLAASLIHSLKVILGRSNFRSLAGELLRLGAITALAMLLAAPWLYATFQGLIAPILQKPMSTQPPELFSGFASDFLTAASGRETLYLAAAGLALAIVTRRWKALTIVAWIALLFVSANPRALGQIRFPFVTNLMVAIMLFIPISLLGGFVIGELIKLTGHWTPLRWRPVRLLLLIGVSGYLAILGARSMLPILNPITFLYRQADTPAILWARDNIEKDAQVLINPFLWGYNLYAGNDGGYWLAPLAGLKTMPPPVLYSLGNNTEYVVRLRESSAKALEYNQNPTALYDFLVKAGIDYVYTGARGGALSPLALDKSPLFHTVYNHEGVWIFKVILD